MRRLNSEGVRKFQPRVYTLGKHRPSKYATPKELANSYRVDTRTFIPQGRNPGLKFANACGVLSFCAKPRQGAKGNFGLERAVWGLRSWACEVAQWHGQAHTPVREYDPTRRAQPDIARATNGGVPSYPKLKPKLQLSK
jgi:hypothetical protein